MTGVENLFVDANVFMYLAGSDPALRVRCREALRAADEQEMALVTSAEVLQEILHRYSALDRLDDARMVYDSVTAICSDIVPVTERETARALELLLRHARLPARDALRVATMETNGIHQILSADRHFDRLESVERVDPADLAGPA
ncbi:MAG: type II toxin-antitoxin system VapC family toxin [Acidobacteria bacterium]|nr:type II toxin-antitoxin system VapC family toxin [Acidobacteriota bacterium]MYH31897.1 type II toxin-antitoxin system VapC family toxin [Acidobacteriota bacterium]